MPSNSASDWLDADGRSVSEMSDGPEAAEALLAEDAEAPPEVNGNLGMNTIEFAEDRFRFSTALLLFLVSGENAPTCKQTPPKLEMG